MKKNLVFLVILLPGLILAQADDRGNLGQDADPLRNYSSDDPLTGQHHDRVIRHGDYHRSDSTNQQNPPGFWPEGGIETGPIDPEDYGFEPRRSSAASSNEVNDLTHEVRRGLNKHRGELDELDGRVEELESLHEDDPETVGSSIELVEEPSDDVPEGETTVSEPDSDSGWLIGFLGALIGGSLVTGYMFLTGKLGNIQSSEDSTSTTEPEEEIQDAEFGEVEETQAEEEAPPQQP